MTLTLRLQQQDKSFFIDYFFKPMNDNIDMYAVCQDIQRLNDIICYL